MWVWVPLQSLNLQISCLFTLKRIRDIGTYSHWQNFLLYCAIFCPFTPLAIWKIKILKKWRKLLDISLFYKTVPKIMIICLFLKYGAWQMQFLVFVLGYFLPFYTPNRSKNQNLKKKRKIFWGYHHFTHKYQKLWSHDVWIMSYGVRQIDEWTDGWTETDGDRKSDI